MRTITKKMEPRSLTEHRKKPHANYDNYPDKDTLRKKLVEEQHGLCCYCQSRIRPNADEMKIEHCKCQSLHKERQLDYSNILGSCLGGHGKPHKKQHCDTYKGDKDLCFNPADKEHEIEDKIRILGNGEIYSEDPQYDDCINKVLNLNIQFLIENRKGVLSAFKDAIDKRKRIDPIKELPKWDGSQTGDLPEYSQIVVYYLYKKLEKMTA